MKRVLSLTLAVGMLLTMLAGCAPAATDKPTTPDSKPSTDNPSTNKPVDTTVPTESPSAKVPCAVVATPTAKVRTDIIIGDGFDIITLDPADSNDAYSGEAHMMIYDRLVQLNEKGIPAPMLAESWENPTPTEYIFKLKKGVKFHNGDEMKASDVVFSILRARDNPKAKIYFERVKDVVATDEYTVTLTTDQPFAPMLLNLTANQGSVLSEKVVKEAEANGGKYGEDPIGTGPMKFSAYRPNDHLKVVRNDDYWNGAVRTTSITRRVIPEESSRTIALESGEIDYLGMVPAIDAKRIKENEKFKVVEMVSSGVAFLGLNTTKAPLDNVKVRQALHMASNKENIVTVLYEGQGIQCTSVFPSIMPSFNDNLNLYPYDPEKAKALMTEAGFPNGFDLEVIVSSDIRSRAAQLLQQDYKEALGVNLDINLMEFGAMLDAISRKDHQSFIMSYSGATNPDSFITANFHTSSGGATGNRMWYSNPEVDKLIEDARIELDWAKREPMYKEIQAKIMADSPWIPLLQQTTVIGMVKGMDGVILYPFGTSIKTNMVIYE